MYERCQQHDLALGPDGQCVICRREASRASGTRFGVTPPEPQAWSARLLTVLLGSGLLIYLGVMAWILLYPETFPLYGSRFWPKSERRSVVPDSPPSPYAPAVQGAAGSGSRRVSYPGAHPDGRGTDRARIVELDPGLQPQGAPESNDPAALPRLQEKDRRLETEQAREEAERDRRRHRMILKERRERDLAAARRSVVVTMYAASWCPSCRRARRYLREKGISYVERDVANDRSAQQRLRQLNPRGSIPTFEIEGQVFVGFNPAGLQSAIDRAARERAKRF